MRGHYCKMSPLTPKTELHLFITSKHHNLLYFLSYTASDYLSLSSLGQPKTNILGKRNCIRTNKTQQQALELCRAQTPIRCIKLLTDMASGKLT